MSMRKWLLMVLLAGCCGLVSCNTFIGMARDVRSAGEGMENAARGRDFNDQGSDPVY